MDLPRPAATPLSNDEPVGYRVLVPLGVYVVLTAVTVPWYWRMFPEAAMRMALGMPLWAAVSVSGSALVSAYTAWRFLQPWPGENQDGSLEPHSLDEHETNSPRESSAPQEN